MESTVAGGVRLGASIELAGFPIDILNVAGPRQSEWPEGYDYAFRALDALLTNL